MRREIARKMARALILLHARANNHCACRSSTADVNLLDLFDCSITLLVFSIQWRQQN